MALQDFFLDLQVVFQELEKDVSNVYKHSVSEARVNSLVDAINEKLLAMVGLIDEDLRDDLASHFLNALVDSFLRILLHGGSNRLDFENLFTVSIRLICLLQCDSFIIQIYYRLTLDFR